MFCLVAWLLDYVMNSDTLLEQCDVDRLWDNMALQLRDQLEVPDRIVIVDTVFRIVRKLLCHHWDTYYSYDLYPLFTATIEWESNREDGEHQRFQDSLSVHSAALNEWFNNAYDGRLSEQIEQVMNAQQTAIKQLRPRGGRRSVNPETITASFVYQPTVQHRQERLQAFHSLLNGTYLQCDLMCFLDIFQGASTTKKILWLRTIKELRYLIDRLTGLGYVTLPQGYGKWQITCARFELMQKNTHHSDDSMTDDSYEIAPLKLSQFNKARERLAPHDEIDRFLEVLSPQLDTDAEIQEYFTSQAELKDYRDALNNGLSISPGR